MIKSKEMLYRNHVLCAIGDGTVNCGEFAIRFPDDLDVEGTVPLTSGFNMAYIIGYATLSREGDHLYADLRIEPFWTDYIAGSFPAVWVIAQGTGSVRDVKNIVGIALVQENTDKRIPHIITTVH